MWDVIPVKMKVRYYMVTATSVITTIDPSVSVPNQYLHD